MIIDILPANSSWKLGEIVTIANGQSIPLLSISITPLKSLWATTSLRADANG
jgi:hypothetical protein